MNEARNRSAPPTIRTDELIRFSNKIPMYCDGAGCIKEYFFKQVVFKCKGKEEVGTPSNVALSVGRN